MKIAISARGLSVKSGGVKEYIKNLIPALLSIDSKNEYYIYYSDKCHLLNIQAKNVHERVLPRAPNFFWDHVILPWHLWRDYIDISLFPKCVVPIFYLQHSIVTVHDMAYFFPGLKASGKFDTLYMKLLIPRSVRKATAVMADSHSTKFDICRFVPNLDSNKVAVAHLAGSDCPGKNEYDVWEKFHLPKTPFIFFSVSLSRRKNLERLLLALETIKDDIPHNFVITGGQAYNNQAIKELVSSSGLNDRFFELGYVQENDLYMIYKEASCYIMPSLYEGFSLTILEAMRAGCPVAASAVSSHPEVAGDSALYFDPYSVEDIAAAILKLTTDSDVRAKLREKGYKQAASFSWSRCAQETLAVIKNIELNLINNSKS